MLRNNKESGALKDSMMPFIPGILKVMHGMALGGIFWGNPYISFFFGCDF
jgi:hypothetical protein